MADLFLDQDLTGTDIEAANVATLASSPFAIEELDAIYRWEVAPAFAFNLRAIAGEWAMWYPHGVRDRVLAVIALPRWRRRLKRFGNPADWRGMRRLVQRRRAGP